MQRPFIDTKPNVAHNSLVELEKLGYIKTLLTQNIDGLHKQAGHQNVIEFDGDIRHLVCLKCKSRFPLNLELLPQTPPYCDICGYLMKPNMVIFGERIDHTIWKDAFSCIMSCDVLVVIGTSGKVQPASEFPKLAHKNDAYIIEINLHPTEYTSSITDSFLQGKASDIIPEILRLVKK